MIRHITLSLFLLLLLVASQTSALASNADDYDWHVQYEIPAYKLVEGVNTDDSFAYTLYYVSIPDPKLNFLVCCMHGGFDKKGYFVMNFDQKRYDYARCISELIFRASRKGFLNRAGKFDFVFLVTCFSGYAPSQVTDIPGWDAKLLLANLNKYKNSFIEEPPLPKKQGNTLLFINYGTPKMTQLGPPQGNIPMNQKRGEKVINTKKMIVLTEDPETQVFIDKQE